MPDENIYKENGYSDRDDYLTCLAKDFSISIDTIYCLADILGEEEDFDLLISALEEAMYLL